MNNLATKSLFIICIALAFLLFRECESNKNCSLDEKEVLTKFVDSRHTISIEETKNLYDNYKKRFIPIIKDIQVTPRNDIDRPEYLPTEYSLIPLQKLKDYINFLDVLQEKNPDQIISGVAINFGAYDLDKQINDESTTSLKNPIRLGDYAGRMTSFFTPTFYNDSIKSDYDADKHIPFCIDFNDASDKFKGTFVSIRGLIEQENNDLSLVTHQKQYFRSPPKKVKSLDDDFQSVSSNEFTDMPPKRPSN